MCWVETYFFSLLQTARLVFVLKTVRPSCLFCHLGLHECGEHTAIVGRPKRDNVWRQRVKNSTMQLAKWFSVPKIVQEGLTTRGLDFYLTVFSVDTIMYCIQRYILTELLNFYLSVSSHLPTGQLSNVPWRRTGVKYTHNEVPSFADIMKNTVFTEWLL